ncbi:MAG: hypothetical protein KF746_15055 [Chitinophagaceae bacterium]|nr:hypothetical protein [Chitinophagaceae bacterium]
MSIKSSILFPVMALLILTVVSGSCKKNHKENDTVTRKVKIVFTSNTTGKPRIDYTDADGTMQRSIALAMNWSKEIVYQASVASASFHVYGDAGYPGEQLTLKIYKNDKLISTTENITAETGEFDLLAPAINF